MIVGTVKETFPGERRVAIVPESVQAYAKKGLEVVIERGAGHQAGFPDTAYEAKGATLVDSRSDVFQKADIVAQVRLLGANPDHGSADLPMMREGQVVLGAADPLSHPDLVKEAAPTGANLFAMELIPRITRAQSMDILSSMATVAGYKAVLWAAEKLPKFFPMFMTAAGTVTPAKAFIVGAGVAGLQGIATAKRLGAVVSAYDVRDAVKEQVESLGAKFVVMELEQAEGEGGYARHMDEEFYRRQREMMERVVAESDVVITTAAVPGRKAPILVTDEMVKGMAPGSVIVDLAAERGGNCELTKVDEEVVAYDVTILGPSNIPSTIPFHASQMYAKNVFNYIANMFNKEKEFVLDPEDEIIRDTWLTKDGAVVQPHVVDLLGQAKEGAN
ncbi:MAG: Re/Si-specific NAD(P)(+) transhydrogenase subunit alpha [Planctomycetota bacterium]|jgi:NAD(P) transhydrogenase subunit alpha